MNKIRRRSVTILLLVAAILAGLALYTLRLWRDGGDWAASRVNGAAYTGGRLRYGAVTDRNGLMLTEVTDGVRAFADDEQVRRATLHIVGDRDGFIGTGALRQYRRALVGYDFVQGLYGSSGGTVTLSIDAGLCVTALEALDGRRGTVAVMNYKTGELLCQVSSPTFDPAAPESEPAEGSYLNNFLSSLYTPGSIYKLVTAAAAIETLPDILDRGFHCDGTLPLSGSTVTCTRAHGDLRLEDALAVSCNCAFAELAVELGPDTMARYAESLGLTSGLRIDGIATAAGQYAASQAANELGWSGAGQFRDLVNPAAMLRLVSAIAGGGVFPGMTQLAGGAVTAERLLSEETAGKLAEMMDYCVALSYGDENFPDLDLHAKSGTAEVGGGKRPNAWFVGFLSDADAPLAFVVVIEEGGWGSSAAGFVANCVLQAAKKVV